MMMRLVILNTIYVLMFSLISKVYKVLLVMDECNEYIWLNLWNKHKFILVWSYFSHRTISWKTTIGIFIKDTIFNSKQVLQELFWTCYIIPNVLGQAILQLEQSKSFVKTVFENKLCTRAWIGHTFYMT